MRIETDADLATAAARLCAREPAFAAVLPGLAPLPLRRRAPGFESLLSALVSQQISTAAAGAIWQRMTAAACLAPPAILAAGEGGLRALGLSRPKVRYILALAADPPDFAALEALPDEEVVAALTARLGIGRWTAEVYALSALGRMDVFPAGDLALQEAARLLFALPERPAERALRALAAPWSPEGAVAARLLWSYYRQAKGREGAGT